MTTRGSTAFDEWERWEATLPKNARVPGQPRPVCPDPHEDGGLPPGWRIWSRYANFNRDTDILLVQRPNGCWVNVFVQHSDHTTFTTGTYVSLVDMYARFLNERQPPSETGRDPGWVRRVLYRLYDPTDPVEAAERFLLALGGVPLVEPRALLGHLRMQAPEPALKPALEPMLAG
jgi:hypothetical protein